MPKNRAPNWTQEELKALVLGYQERKEVIDGKFSPLLTYEDKNKAYEAITNAVNAVNNSSKRSIEQVKKQLVEIKSKAKRKAAAIQADFHKTGGELVLQVKLTPIEEMLVSKINPQIFEGEILGNDSKSVAITSDNSNITFPNMVTTNDIPSSSISSETSNDEGNSIPLNKMSLKKRQYIKSMDIKVALLEIERSKRDIAYDFLKLKKIAMKAKLKELQHNGIDVREELEELNEM